MSVCCIGPLKTSFPPASAAMQGPLRLPPRPIWGARLKAPLPAAPSRPRAASDDNHVQGTRTHALHYAHFAQQLAIPTCCTQSTQSMMSRYAKHLSGTGSGPLQQRRARSPCSHPTQFAHHMAESLLRFPCSPSRLKQCKVASDAIAAIVGLEALNLVHVSAGARGVLRLKRDRNAHS